MIKPEYVTFKDEQVLFVRRTGDYKETPSQAFQALVKYLQDEGIGREKIKTYYSMGLDDPQIVDRAKCRFDACVALKEPISPKGEVGQRVLRGGRFATFIHKGPYSKLEEAFNEIFQTWYPSSNEKLADEIPFCEHISAWDKSISDDERVTKIYIPLENK